MQPHHLFWAGSYERNLSTEQADELQRLIDLDAPSGPPEGVHAAPDGTLLCRGRDLPPGPWERRLVDRLSREWSSNADFAAAGDVDRGFQDRWYEVRPVAPEPVRVRWQDAIGRRLPDGREVTGAWNDRGTPRVGVEGENGLTTTAAEDPVPPVDADGMVAVLPLDGDQ